MLVNQRLDKESSEGSLPSKIQWHPTQDLLGVASSIPLRGGFLSFFTKRGGKAFFSSKLKTDSHPTLIQWHDRLTLLAVGWDSGSISLVDPVKPLEYTSNQNNFSKVHNLVWNEDGSILLAIDMVCCIRIFKHIAREKVNELALLHETRLEDETPVCAITARLNKNSIEKGENSISNDTPDESDTLTKLLSKHRKFMDFEKRKAVEPANLNVNQKAYSVAFVATQKGSLYACDLNKNGEVFHVFQADSEIFQMLSIPEQIYILVITKGMMFYQLYIEGRHANDRIKVKLAGRPDHFSMMPTSGETIAFCYDETEIRVWDLRNEDSAILPLSTEKGYTSTDRIVALSYSAKKGCISGFTEGGKMANWRSKHHLSSKKSDVSILDNWRLQSAVQITVEKLFQAEWSPVSATLATRSEKSVGIFVSQGVAFHADHQYVILQITPQLLSLTRIADPPESDELRLHTNIHGFFVANDNLLIWDESRIQFDQIVYTNNSPMSIQQVSSFEFGTETVTKAVYHNKRILLMFKDRVDIKTVQGTLEQSIKYRDSEGTPTVIDLNGNWFCVATSKAHIFIYDMADQIPKLTFRSTNLSNLVERPWDKFAKFASVRVNSNGSRVSFTVQEGDNIQQKLYIWEAETENVCYFSFRAGMTDQQMSESLARPETAGRRPKTTAAKRLEQSVNQYRLLHYAPVNHLWDKKNPTFLVCDANPIELDENKNGNVFMTMFVTAEHGIQLHDLQSFSAAAEALIYVDVPFLFFLRNPEIEEENDPQLEVSISRLIMKRKLREFVDVDVGDERAVEAMLNFSYYLCIGQMDNAFKAIKYVKNESVWEHMAQMCVKTRRIDVARVCLGHMQNWRAVRALNASIANGDTVELQTARLAVELNMTDAAIEIYKSLERYDLLNNIYQAQGRWENAFEVAKTNDRIHLRNTHYNYARFLESVGNIELAIENYEMANVHHFEVPRMLCDEPNALEFYIKQRKQPELYKWWAQYLESVNNLEAARNFYTLASDYLSVVRILCYSDHANQAVDIVNRCGDRAAAFHLANHFEVNEQPQLAVQYFEKAGAYNTAIRLAMRYDMSDKLASLALMAGGGELVKVAQYYENLDGHADKAIMLYHKAEMIGRALDLAFRTEQLSALDLIAQDLNANSDPRVLERAAQFFASNQRHHTAVQLLAFAKKYTEAVALCMNRNVIINEEIEELLTPPKSAKMGESERIHLLENIARCCLQQGNYHFAAKKFAQAGKKIDAMRALLKSGDTDRIILFANTARSKDIYKMVGNYLQTLNWKEDAQLMRHVESFYVKAGALELLASFYEACAEAEIDEYRDYEKALAAYNEAMRCLTKFAQEHATKSSDGTQPASERRNSRAAIEQKQAHVYTTIEKIKRFLLAKEKYNTDPGEALRILGEMTEEEGINETVRLGDIFAIIVMHNVNRNNFRKAFQIIEQCATLPQKVDMNQFLSQATIERIYAEVGVELPTRNRDGDVEETDERVGDVEYSHFMRRQMAASTQ